MADLVVDKLNISQLSDEELSEKLQAFGFSSGPIVDSTRLVYQRKLARLLLNEELQMSDEDEENIPPKADFIISPPRIDLSTPPSFRYDDLRRRPLPRIHNSSLHDDSFNYIPTGFIVSQVKEPATVSEEAKDSNFSVIVAIVILGCFLVFALLIYQNMESSVVNPVPPDLDG